MAASAITAAIKNAVKIVAPVHMYAAQIIGKTCEITLGVDPDFVALAQIDEQAGLFAEKGRTAGMGGLSLKNSTLPKCGGMSDNTSYVKFTNAIRASSRLQATQHAQIDGYRL